MAPRITPADVEASIDSEHYFTAGDGVAGDCFRRAAVLPSPRALETLTFCVLVLRNGTKIVGINYGAISIENPKGSERKGVDKDGTPWSTTMRNHYSYIKGSVGADKDHVDAFLSDAPESGRVFIVDQVDQKTGAFDEHKAMVGFETEAQAREAYLSNYEQGWQGLGAITPMEHADFKKWVFSKKTKKAVGDISKADRPSAETVTVPVKAEAVGSGIYTILKQARDAGRSVPAKNIVKALYEGCREMLAAGKIDDADSKIDALARALQHLVQMDQQADVIDDQILAEAGQLLQQIVAKMEEAEAGGQPQAPQQPAPQQQGAA